MKRSLALVLMLFLSSVVLAQKPRGAILEFKNKSMGGHHYGYHEKIGAAAKDMLLTELVKSGKCAVIEREQISPIMEKGEKLSEAAVVSGEPQVGDIVK